MMPSIEQGVDWISDCIDHVQATQKNTIDTTEDVQAAWVAHVNAVADATLLPTCNSWYLGANVPGKPRVFMPLFGYGPYVEKCNDVTKKNYEGFIFT